MYHTYILESGSDGKWYYISTGRLEDRVAEHNYDNGHYSGSRGPWKLLFKRPFEIASEAQAFERHLKKSRNKEFIRRAFAEFFVSRLGRPGIS